MLLTIAIIVLTFIAANDYIPHNVNESVFISYKNNVRQDVKNNFS